MAQNRSTQSEEKHLRIFEMRILQKIYTALFIYVEFREEPLFKKNKDACLQRQL